MSTNTKESALEACIERHLTGGENRRIALESLISQAVNKERKKDLDLYKIYAGDPDFKKAFEESIIRILALLEKSKPA